MSDNGERNASHEALQAVHESMVDGLGQLASYFGFSKVMGQLYGALLMSPRPLCLDDMMAKLDISKANVSMNVRTLEHMGMVRQVWVKGSGGRRKYYEAETDFWKIISNVLAGREMREVERALSVLNDGIARLSEERASMSEADRQTAEVYLERIVQIQALFRFAQMVMTTILARSITDLGKLDVDRK